MEAFIILLIFAILNGIYAYINYRRKKLGGAILNAFACGFCLSGAMYSI